jgi:hypothetical protein
VSSLSQKSADLCVLREASLLLLREDQLPIPEDVELALLPGLDLGLVLGLGVQLGRETRGPFVVAVSDRAVLNEDRRHGKNLPAQMVLNCSKGCRQLSQ